MRLPLLPTCSRPFYLGFHVAILAADANNCNSLNDGQVSIHKHSIFHVGYIDAVGLEFVPQCLAVDRPSYLNKKMYNKDSLLPKVQSGMLLISL